MFNNAGENAGLSAAKEAHAAIDGAIDTIDHQTIPAATAAAKAIVGETVNGLYAVLVDMSNRLNGAEVPINVTITISGKIGPVKLNNPVEMQAQQIEVKG